MFNLEAISSVTSIKKLLKAQGEEELEQGEGNKKEQAKNKMRKERGRSAYIAGLKAALI